MTTIKATQVAFPQVRQGLAGYLVRYIAPDGRYGEEYFAHDAFSIPPGVKEVEVCAGCVRPKLRPHLCVAVPVPARPEPRARLLARP